MIYLALVAALAVAALVYEKRLNTVREREWALERGALLQRIQAPEIAIAESADREPHKRPALVALDSDEAFEKLREERLAEAD